VAVELPEDYCLLSAMKALSSDQLINIIGQIVIDHPGIEKVYNIIDMIKK
jgi:hemin uptake protein HemP